MHDCMLIEDDMLFWLEIHRRRGFFLQFQILCPVSRQCGCSLQLYNQRRWIAPNFHRQSRCANVLFDKNNHTTSSPVRNTPQSCRSGVANCANTTQICLFFKDKRVRGESEGAAICRLQASASSRTLATGATATTRRPSCPGTATAPCPAPP